MGMKLETVIEWLEGLGIVAAPYALCILLASCGTRIVESAPTPSADPGTLTGLGEWAIWLGGACLLLAIVAAILAPPGLRKRAGSIAVLGGSLIAGGWLLGWIDAWLALIMSVALALAVLVGAAWLWRRRFAIEKQLGVDIPDWMIGESPAP